MRKNKISKLAVAGWIIGIVTLGILAFGIIRVLIK